MEIKRISGLETYPVRHPVLRPGRPIEDCYFEGDALDSTIHLGFYENEILLAVASFLKNTNSLFTSASQYQLRGMAVLNEAQGKGFGKLLINHGENLLKQLGIEIIWFNAREIAVPFYKKMGYETIGDSFIVPNIGTHYVMFKTFINLKSLNP